MQERGILVPQIWTVLKSGPLQHVEPDINTGLDKYRVAGSDADGRIPEVVVSLDETGQGCVVVITVIESRGDDGQRGRSSRKGR